MWPRCGPCLAAARSYDQRVSAFIRVVAATGARRGEVCALRWSDVDWDWTSVRIDEAIVATDGGVMVKAPKNRSSVRAVALDASTLDELDRLAEQATWRNGNSQPRPSVMPLDAYRRGDRFLIHFDLPGVDPSTVDLTVEKNVLQVQAERSWPREEGDEVVVAERPQGTFSRQLFLGEGLDPERIGASYDQGVLTVTIPVAEQAKPRKVEISAGGASGSATIDANSSAA